MWLLNKKNSKKKFIDNVLSAKRIVLSDEDMEQCLNDMRDGINIEPNRRLLIDGYTIIAINIAAQYATKAPFLAEDILGEVMLTLVEEIEKIRLKELEEGKEIVSYTRGRLTVSLHAAAFNFVIQQVNGLCKRSYIKKYKKDLRLIFDSSLINNQLESSQSKELTEILDILHRLIEREQDEKMRAMIKEVINMRILGIKDPEIAQKLGLSVCYVSLIRRQLKKDFFKEYDH